MAFAISASIQEADNFVDVCLFNDHVEVDQKCIGDRVEFFNSITDAFEHLETLKHTKRGISQDSINHLKNQMANALAGGSLERMETDLIQKFTKSALFLSDTSDWLKSTVKEQDNED